VRAAATQIVVVGCLSNRNQNLNAMTDRWIHGQEPPEKLQVEARVCPHCRMEMFSHEALTADDGTQSHKECYELDEGGM